MFSFGKGWGGKKWDGNRRISTAPGWRQPPAGAGWDEPCGYDQAHAFLGSGFFPADNHIIAKAPGGAGGEEVLAPLDNEPGDACPYDPGG